MNKTNLFLAGFQKCGSSTLFDLLCKHPNITGTNPKETYFFVDKGYENFISDFNLSARPNALDEKYKNRDGLENKYCLEGSVCNFYQKTAMDYAKKHTQVKVLFVIRNPIERFESIYNYFGTNGLFLPPGTSINKYFELVNSETIKSELLKFGIDHGKYSNYINQWIDIIGADRISITSLANLKNDQQKEMNRIFDFLNLNSQEVDVNIHNNKTTQIWNSYLHLFLKSLFQGWGHTSLAKFYSKWNKGGSRATVDDELRAKLESSYVEEFRKYSDFF